MPTQKPSVGRIVQFAVHPAVNGGVDHVAAVVTQVFNDELVNLQLLPNVHDTRSQLRTSVPLFATRDEYDANAGAPMPGATPFGAWWPPRV